MNQRAPVGLARLVDLASYAVLALLATAVGAGLAAIISSLGISDASSHVFWYVSRTAGLTAYLVLFANMVLGLGVKTKMLDSLLARWRSFDLHQFTALLAMGLLALHVLSLLGDQYIGFSLAQLIVPFTSSYRPLPIALGIIALYALVVVTATFYIRDRIGQKAWRSIHYVSFVAFFVVLLHGVYSGTDSVLVWARMMYLTSGVVVAVLTAGRFLESSGSASAKRSKQPAVAAAGRSGQTVA